MQENDSLLSFIQIYQQKGKALKLTTAFNVRVHNFSTDAIGPILTGCVFPKKVLKKKKKIYLFISKIKFFNKLGTLK